MIESTQRIIEILLAIPAGKVISYGNVAARAGLPNGARQVVRVLHSQSEKYKLPWYRILKSNGAIALASGSGAELQAELLRSEGVEVSQDGLVDLKKFGWTG